MSAQALEDLKAEIHHLETVAREEIAERIRTARDFGDLKENSEYHDAKNDQAHLETKIARLRDKLLSAEVVEAPTSFDAVAFGSRVELRDEKSGRVDVFKLVSVVESKPSEGRLSAESPLAQALLGARVGDTVAVPTPRGERRVTVVAIS